MKKIPLRSSQAYIIPCLRMEDKDGRLLKGAMEENIISLIANEFSVSIDDLRSKTRKHEVTKPRQIVEYVFVRTKNYKLIDAGNVLGLNRDHATVIHSVRVVDNSVRTEPEFKKKLNSIIKKLERYERGTETEEVL